jgi:hypothetical protein
MPWCSRNRRSRSICGPVRVSALLRSSWTRSAYRENGSLNSAMLGVMPPQACRSHTIGTALLGAVGWLRELGRNMASTMRGRHVVALRMVSPRSSPVLGSAVVVRAVIHRMCPCMVSPAGKSYGMRVLGVRTRLDVSKQPRDCFGHEGSLSI